MSLPLLLSFAGLCLVLALTPGPDTFLVLRYSITGARAGLAAALGSALGGIAWAVVVAAGLATLLEQSATAYRALKIIGGVYLLYLGVRALWDRRRGADTTETAATAELAPAPTRSALLAGLLSCVFNPKVGLFYLAVLPQFMTEVTFGNTLVLGAIESSIAAVEMAVLAVAAARAVTLLRRPTVRDRLERISAGILATLGVAVIADGAH